MAADFMVHPALFRNNFFLLLLIPITWLRPSCNQATEALAVNGAAVAFQRTNGVLHVDNKPFTGVLFWLYAGTQDTAAIEGYARGVEQGTWKKFYTGGLLQERRDFNAGKKVGDYFAWWENGHPKLHYVFKDDEYEGTCREWNSAGMLIKEMNYHKGYEAGTQKMFYDNGKVRSNYIIMNGRRFGLLGTKNCMNVPDSVFKN